MQRFTKALDMAKERRRANRLWRDDVKQRQAELDDDETLDDEIDEDLRPFWSNEEVGPLDDPEERQSRDNDDAFGVAI